MGGGVVGDAGCGWGKVLQKCSGGWARGLTSGGFDCSSELLEFGGGGGITRLFQPAVHVRMLQKYSGGVACENVTKIQWWGCM